MKNRWIAIASLLIGSLAVYSCIDPDQTEEVTLQRDIESIEAYIEENPIASVKDFSVPQEGIYMFWTEAIDSEVNTDLLRADTVVVNYTGRLLTDVVFDTSIEQTAKDNNIYSSSRNYIPLTFPLGYGYVISGFEYALSLMKAGEKATVIFPSRLGYGTNSTGSIPANSPLIFELELEEIKLGPNH